MNIYSVGIPCRLSVVYVVYVKLLLSSYGQKQSQRSVVGYGSEHFLTPWRCKATLGVPLCNCTVFVFNDFSTSNQQLFVLVVIRQAPS